MSTSTPSTLPTVAKVKIEETENEAEQVVEEVEETDNDANNEPAPLAIEQKYHRHPLLTQYETPEPAEPEQTQEDILDQAVGRALAAHCHMKEHKTDYYDSEIEQISNATMQLLMSKMVLEHEKKRVKVNATSVQARVKQYLTIYFQLHQLKQAQQRRIEFFNEYKDLVAIAQSKDFVDDMADEFATSIDQVTLQLDELLHPPPPNKSKKPKKTSLHDVVVDVKSRRK